MQMIPVVIGLGCQRGVSLSTLQEAIAEALARLQPDCNRLPSPLPRSAPLEREIFETCHINVCCLASYTLKSDEPALLALAQKQGWPLIFYTAEQLGSVAGLSSGVVVADVAMPPVAEAAALLASGAPGLLVAKQRYRGADGKSATVAIARYAGQQMQQAVDRLRLNIPNDNP